jgi:hypothetical protein
MMLYDPNDLNRTKAVSHHGCPSILSWRWGSAVPVLAFSALLCLWVAACGGEKEGDPTMKPGERCLSCHQSGGKAIFSAAGTVYSSDGTGARGVTVRLADSKGVTKEFTTNEVGNFYFRDALTPPFTVVLTSGGVSVSMPTPADNGDCNSCHKAGGEPGHIVFSGAGGGN